MDKSKAQAAPQFDRWSFVWLGLAAGLLLFSSGRWIIPVAAWLSPVFLIRFLRTQKLWRGFGLGVLAYIVTCLFASQGYQPLYASQDHLLNYLLFVTTISIIAFLPYMADRVLTPRLPNFAATLIFPLALTSLEYLSSLVGPYGTWGSLAYSQYGNLPLLQLVSVTGLWGLSFLVAWLGPVINWAWEHHFEWLHIRFGLGLYGGVLALVMLIGGASVVLFPPQSETVRVAGLSSSQTISSKWDTLKAEGIWQRLGAGESLSGPDIEKMRTVAKLSQDDLLVRSEREARAGAKIIFWSEGNAWVLEQDEAQFIEQGRALARQYNLYLGMSMGVLRPGQKLYWENKVVLVEPSGQVAWQYEKTHLVLGSNEPATTVPGQGLVPTLSTPYGRIATVICFDEEFPTLLRQASQAGTDLLFVPSNDWPEIAATRMQMSVFHAIEQGFSIIRVTSHGLSVAADYQGRVLALSDYYSGAEPVMVAAVPVKGTATIYSGVGDAFGWISLVSLVSLTGWMNFRIFKIRRARAGWASFHLGLGRSDQ